MRVQAEVRLHPPRTATLMGSVDSFAGCRRRGGPSVAVGSTSSRVSGECKHGFGVLGEAFEVAARPSDVVVTVTVANACPGTGGMMPDARKARPTVSHGGT